MQSKLRIMALLFFSLSLPLSAELHDTSRSARKERQPSKQDSVPRGVNVAKEFQKKADYCVETLKYPVNFTPSRQSLTSKTIRYLLNTSGADLSKRVTVQLIDPTAQAEEVISKYFSLRKVANGVYTGTTTACGILHLSSLDISTVEIAGEIYAE